MAQSLKATGKSRADLWAFATQLGALYAMDQNNRACRGESVDKEEAHCPHLYTRTKVGFPCEITLRPFTFQTGRRDCVGPCVMTNPTGHRPRAFESRKEQVQPNPSGNGQMTVDFFKKGFDGFTVTDTVSIMGAHALGKFHGLNSLFKYDWTRTQTSFLNNQYYRILMMYPSKMMQCGDTRAKWKRVA